MDETPTTKKFLIRDGLAIAANAITIAVVLVPLVVTWLRSPVTVEVESGQTGIPPYLYSRLVDMTKALGDGTRSAEAAKTASDARGKHEDIGVALKDLSQRLLRVRAVQRVTLTNGSNATIKDLSARLPNVWNAEFFSVECNTCTQSEKDAVLASCKFDEFTNHVVIGPFPRLAPRSIVTVSIFGDFGMSLGPPVTASYADGEARLVKSEKVEGLSAVVASMGPFGLLVIAFLYLGHQLLRRVK
jgi:hypothetical protein